MQTITQYWSGEAVDIKKSIDEATRNTESLDAQISVSRAKLSWKKPQKFLSGVWARISEVPALIEDRKASEDSRKTLVKTLTDKASKHANRLVDIKIKEDPDISQTAADLIRRLGANQSAHKQISNINDHTVGMLNKITRAIEEVDEAMSAETWDMIGNNALTTMISHGETSEAKEHIDYVRQELKSYKAFMSSQKLDAGDTDTSSIDLNAMMHTAEWDFWLGVFDVDVFSFFTSWKNHGQLSEAKDKLQEIHGKIMPIHVGARETLKSIRQEAGELDQERLTLRYSVARTYDLPDLFYEFVPKPEKIPDGVVMAVVKQSAAGHRHFDA